LRSSFTQWGVTGQVAILIPIAQTDHSPHGVVRFIWSTRESSVPQKQSQSDRGFFSLTLRRAGCHGHSLCLVKPFLGAGADFIQLGVEPPNFRIELDER